MNANKLVFFFFLAIRIAKADTIAIGCFDLPLAFESVPPGEPVFSLVTNDVVRYFAPVSHFSDRFRPGETSVLLKARCFLVHLAENPLFEEHVSFVEEQGVTNVVIGTALVQAVDAILPDLDFKTNLLAGAESFLSDFTPENIALVSAARRRLNYRTVVNGTLVPFSAEQCSDEQMLSSQTGFAEAYRFFKPCLLELNNTEFGQTNAWTVPVREYNPTAPSYGSIGCIGIAFFDGCWSFVLSGH